MNTLRYSAKCHKMVVIVVMAVVLMLGLEVTVWADEDDDEKAEMRDFVAAVYRGQGQYNMAGSIATGEGGVILLRSSSVNLAELRRAPSSWGVW